jgi:hypothetical protein
MDENVLITISELISIYVTILLGVVLFRFARKNNNYVVAASIFPLGVELIYFILLFMNVQPIKNSVLIRDWTIRPSQWIFFGLMMVFFMNGTVNEKIKWVHLHSVELFRTIALKFKSVVKWNKNASIHQ